VTALKVAAGERVKVDAILLELDPGEKIGSGIVLVLPECASAALPSRGMNLIEGTINDVPFQAVVEPNGKGSHWFKVSDDLREAAHAGAGSTVTLEIEPSKDWPEPKVPADLAQALTANPRAQALWLDITPMARWDWIRWIGATRSPRTRQRRIVAGIDKMVSGKRRPCCFDRGQRTLTDA